MKKIKIVDKGYTLTVVSWENDGDNYETKSQTFENKDLVIAVTQMCNTLFISCNNGEGGIGNTNEGDEDEEDEAKDKILEYMKSEPILLQGNKYKFEDDEDIIGFCMEKYNYGLLGRSEWYFSRVCESVTITYSPEDIYVEQIEF